MDTPAAPNGDATPTRYPAGFRIGKRPPNRLGSRRPALISAPATVRSVIAGDHIVIDLAGLEIDLILVGVILHPNPRLAEAAGDWLDRRLNTGGPAGHHAEIPMPPFCRDWLRHLSANPRHAGVLYPRGCVASVALELAEAGLCSLDPNCLYLSPSWTRPPGGDSHPPRPQPAGPAAPATALATPTRPTRDTNALVTAKKQPLRSTASARST
jgi:hypothetical protein